MVLECVKKEESAMANHEQCVIGVGVDHLKLDAVLGIPLRTNISNERGMVEQGLTHQRYKCYPGY